MADPTIAQQVFESWGVKCTSVPTSRQEEADWLVEIDGCIYLVEEKTKFPNPEELLKRSIALNETNQYLSTRSVSKNNCLSGIIKKANKQLKSSGSSKNHQFRLVWFTAIGWDAETKHMQFMSTLYGTSKVFEIDGHRMLQCYFFYDSEFFRSRMDLDGAISAYISGDNATMFLCLNPYSPRYKELCISPIVTLLPKGLTDPLAEERCGTAYVADTDLDRKDSQAVLRFLELKYATTRLANMDFKMASVEFRLPPP